MDSLSSYQILRAYACAQDQHFAKISSMEDESWLAEEHVPFLRAAREFRREPGRRSSVPDISIFGYRNKTPSTVILRRSSKGELSDIAFLSTTNGDGGVLETSAVLPGNEIHPVQQYHGSLFVDNDVKMRLKLELARQSSFYKRSSCSANSTKKASSGGLSRPMSATWCCSAS